MTVESTPQPIQPLSPSHEALMFPTLTPEQVAHIAPHGTVRAIARGQVLIEAGDPVPSFFVVRSGRVEIIRPSSLGDVLVAVHGPGKFTGEANLILGRRSLTRALAAEDGEVIQVTRDQLLALVQTDAALSEVLMRAFVYRRLELTAHGVGDVVLIGSDHCKGTLRIREFLTRNEHPFGYIDLDRDADVQALLDRFHIAIEEVPVLICRGETVLRNPSNQKIAECLGFNEAIDRSHVRDLVIVGGGPAGLAAAVYGASEGLDVLVLESMAPGGQAGSSSRIENYLGFPMGISGQDLAGRAYAQAQKFGAQVMIANSAKQLACGHHAVNVLLDDGTRVAARALIIATGAEYRKPPLENLPQFEGAGVYYGATPMEARLCGGEEVVVVGGGNSAGQAAVFLAQTSSRVHMLVRGDGLADTMSRYLIRRLEENPAITLRTRTEIVGLEGDLHLQRVRWRDNRTGDVETRNLRHVFMMTGAVPNTSWLDGCVVVDSSGFIKTGPDLTHDDLVAAEWPLSRPPYLLETSHPGVFAVGDVRAGSFKRVASAVGEGSIAVAFVHQVLHQ